MDDDEELERALREFGFEPSRMDRDEPDDSAPPRWDETDELGDWE